MRIEGQLTQKEEDDAHSALTNFLLATVGAHPHGFEAAVLKAVYKPTGEKRTIAVLHKDGPAGVAVMPLFAFIQNDNVTDYELPDGKGGYAPPERTVTGYELELLNRPTKGEPS